MKNKKEKITIQEIIFIILIFILLTLVIAIILNYFIRIPQQLDEIIKLLKDR